MYCKPDSGTVVMERQMEIHQTSGPDAPRMPDSGPDNRFTAHLEHTCTAIMDMLRFAAIEKIIRSLIN